MRAGIEGVKLGYGDLERGTAKTGSDEWPEKLEASDVEVHWLAPGAVYGSYRFAVTIDGETQRGLSERVFLRGEDGRWRISVSTAFYEMLRSAVTWRSTGPAAARAGAAATTARGRNTAMQKRNG